MTAKKPLLHVQSFCFFAYFLLPVVMVVLSSLERYNAKQFWYETIAPEKPTTWWKTGEENRSPQVPLQRHMSYGQQSIATIMTLPQLLQISCLLTTLSCDAEVSWSWGTFELISSHPELPGLRERDVLDRVRPGYQVTFVHFEKFYCYCFYYYSLESTPAYKVNEVGNSQVDGFACGNQIRAWWHEVCSPNSRKRRKFTTVFWHYSSFTNNIMDDKCVQKSW